MINKKSVCFSFFRNQKRKPRFWWEAGRVMNQRRLVCVCDLPEDFFSGAKWNECFLSVGKGFRSGPGFLDQCHGTRVAWEPIEVGTEVAGESFEPIECAGGVEDLGIERQRGVSRVATRTAASRFLRVSRVRCRVGTEEELRTIGGGRSEEGLPVFFALEDRETVVVRSDTSLEEIVAIEEEMMRSDRRGDIGIGGLHEFDHFPGRNVFDDDAEVGMFLDDRVEGFDETRFPVEDIDFPLVILQGFTVNGKDETVSLHGPEDRIELSDVGHAGRGIGRGIGRIELGCQDVLACGGDDDIRDRRVIGEVDGHERIEISVLRRSLERLEDTAAVVERVAGLSDRRLEIGHDERSTEDPGGVPEYRPHFFSIPKVQMPVIWPTERNGSLSHGDTSCFRLSLREDFVCRSNDASHAPGFDDAE